MDITANKKRNAKEQLNSISGLHIQFDKLKKETRLLSGALQSQVANEAMLAARHVQSKVLENKEQEEQYEDVLDEKDKSDQASTLSPQMARVIRWNVFGLYNQKAHWLH